MAAGGSRRDLGAEAVPGEQNDHEHARDHDRAERDAQQGDVDVALGRLHQHARAVGAAAEDLAADVDAGTRTAA